MSFSGGANNSLSEIVCCRQPPLLTQETNLPKTRRKVSPYDG